MHSASGSIWDCVNFYGRHAAAATVVQKGEKICHAALVHRVKALSSAAAPILRGLAKNISKLNDESESMIFFHKMDRNRGNF